MSNTTSDFVPAPSEKTFSSYTPDQGAKYAQARPGYSPSLYASIIAHHTSTGGKLDTLVDVGCGPGMTARALAPNFTHTIGLDPSEGMITTARSLDPNIRFEISTAEDLGWHLDPKIEDESVDLITASTAAHWFDMTRFWPRAAQILKPGGTVALWGTGGINMHPSMPNAVAIQAMFDDFEERELKPFFEPGNLISRNLYKDMPLPWTLSPKVEAFEEKTFFRREWGLDNSGFYEAAVMEVDLDRMEKAQATLSPVHRWREANPEKVGTEEDIVRIMRRGVERLLHEAGVEKGKEVVKGSLSGVLIMAKKKA
ncbi:S-adenosyl-L-methionine-dependent methyltransferase [Mollisia scopiformis]|uniref:S-adenosyl-L-methionine-dependent methyltransferase n=1 Tax=Mollisia scopiformis TaxID=149040 RepID=A0A132B7Y8_MOLSC|nr:S-adenosyl-L-methionine-dependent methyltransferase [Mollisia scopiformis]KUJ07797.1 S-adenosyl-L-methionine-dependent methyltransferase [Mollisia scopiformis]